MRPRRFSHTSRYSRETCPCDMDIWITLSRTLRAVSRPAATMAATPLGLLSFHSPLA